VSHAEQTKKRNTLILQVGGLGHKANNLPSMKNLISEKPNNGCRLDNSGERPRKIYQNYDFCTATWNVIHLYGVGMLKQKWKNAELIMQQSKR
jgi:hypothetical protein